MAVLSHASARRIASMSPYARDAVILGPFTVPGAAIGKTVCLVVLDEDEGAEEPVRLFASRDAAVVANALPAADADVRDVKIH